ncbi:MAG: MarR family transcriptional regulator [Dehalococcoidales bacterium]|jgi:DNA-binding MarR family transcriptional regulator
MARITSDSDELFRLSALLRNVGHIINRIHDRELRQHDITARQVGVLGVIKRFGNEATITEVSRRLLRDPSTIFNIINVLHRKGLISKNRDATNRHWVRLSLTDQGEVIYEKALQIDKVALIMSALTPNEREQMLRCLETLRNKGISELRDIPENL